MVERPEVPDVGAEAMGDRLYYGVLWVLGMFVLVVAGLIVLNLALVSRPLFAVESVWDFVQGDDWDPVTSKFGALPFIYGTLVTSIVSIVVAVPVAVGLALFITQFAPKKLAPFLSTPVEWLAAIPSVVYGLWGLAVLIPWLRTSVEPFLGRTLGFLPFFKGPPLGFGYLAAGLVLAVMILPTIVSVSAEVMKTTPEAQREAALALGATTWESVTWSVVPHSRAGILGACLLGLGRALGETMAVTMLIGNSRNISISLFAPGYSLPAVIANEFAEATSDVHIGALAACGLILFVITFLLNAAARWLVTAVQRGPARIVT
ncbi:MAG: phosphate ABC transporter permease subunit PstC [Myxococcaceae bacterium]